MVSIQNAYNLLNRRYEYGLSEITDYIGISLLPIALSLRPSYWEIFKKRYY